MKSIYTLIPFATKAIPQPGTVGKVFSDYFYLFKVYTDSLYWMHTYIRYLNGNFHNVIDDMGFQIVEYKYPDNLEYSSGKMIEWINDHYNLADGCSSLDIYNELDVEVEFNQILGKDVAIMTNACVPSDIMLTEYAAGIFEDYDGWREIVTIASYIVDKELSQLISDIMLRMANHAKSAIALNYGCCEYYDSKFIHEQYFILYQQKAFVRKEIKEGRERNDHICT